MIKSSFMASDGTTVKWFTDFYNAAIYASSGSYGRVTEVEAGADVYVWFYDRDGIVFDHYSATA